MGSPYRAQSRLKFGDGFIAPGEPVPVEPGRNYAQMLALGEIVYVGDGGTTARPKAAGLPHEGNLVREQSARGVRQAQAKSK